MAALKYWLWLTTCAGVDHVAALRLLEHFGTVEAAYFADAGEYQRLGLSRQACAALVRKELDGAEKILGDCDRLGIQIITIQDARYPERLRQISDPPCVLYVKGRLFAFDEELAIAVVGSRRPTPYGVHMAGHIGLDLARRGALVVSGIAQGLDSTALHGALSGGGSVVSVLGGGIDVIYPPSSRLLYEDVAAAGALISEYPPGTETLGWHYPIRNRIISGLSLGTVVVEAAEHSGALITARTALDQNREVFAFPGPADGPMSRGTNRLIQTGQAKLILSADDVLEEFAGIFPHRIRTPEPLTQEEAEARLAGLYDPEDKTSARIGNRDVPQEEVDKRAGKEYSTQEIQGRELTDDERDILLALEGKLLQPDDLIEATQIPARRVLSALTMLQLQGYVTEQPGKRFAAAVRLCRQ